MEELKFIFSVNRVYLVEDNLIIYKSCHIPPSRILELMEAQITPEKVIAEIPPEKLFNSLEGNPVIEGYLLNNYFTGHELWCDDFSSLDEKIMLRATQTPFPSYRESGQRRRKKK